MAIKVSKLYKGIFMYTEEELYNFRNYFIAYSNDFATKSDYSFSIYAHRLFLYILAKIPSSDGKRSNIQEYIEVDFNHFIAVYNLPPSGVTYKKIREALLQLQNCPVYEEYTFLESTLEIKKTVYKVTINHNLDRHFYNLKSYVQFPLLSVMGFSSVYAFQIYAALLSKFNLSEYMAKKAGNEVKGHIEKFIYKPEMITRMLNLEQLSYKIYKNLNSAVIKKAINDINLYADLYVEYQGNNSQIIFSVRRKTSDEQLISYASILKKFH